MYNDNMKFVDTHEWVMVVESDIVKIGITHHAQDLLGDLVHLELTQIGRCVSAHDVIGVIESVKAASDLYSPITGEIIQINDKVIANPALANSDPHGNGWLLIAKLSNVTQLNNLMSSKEYMSLINYCD